MTALFGEKAQEARSMEEEARADEVYETLEKMPSFWQRSDTGEEHIRTLLVCYYCHRQESMY